MIPPTWGTRFPKGTGLCPVLAAFMNQTVAKPKAVVETPAPKVHAKHAARSAANGVPKTMPAPIDSCGLVAKMRVPDFTICQ